MADKKKKVSEPKPEEKNPKSAENSKHWQRVITYTILIFVACWASGLQFLELRRAAAVYPSATLSDKKKLSDYLPSLRHSRGDSEALIFEGRNLGGTMMILGGTHPNEPASNMSAVILAENLNVEYGKVIVIHRANASAFTATEPQEAFPQEYSYENRGGRTRWFQVGSRYSNILDGWPDPTVYRHHPSGQLLSGPETRNLNRSFPGRKNGSLTERIAYAITEVVRQEKVDLFVDLHEAAPEYPVINALVAHQRAVDMAAMATVELQMNGIDIALEVSPENFHGLSHREIGDFTETNAVLMETAGAMQGRIRGATTVNLIKISRDPFYHKASELGKLAVDFPAEGISMEVRVGRHLEAISVLSATWSEFNPDKPISFNRVPSYEELNDHGIGFYLN